MKVIEMTTHAFWKGEFGITGLIEDEGHQYKANLEVKGGQINVYSCSCANGISYKGMCSHCRALFESYQSQAGTGRQKTVATSPAVRSMIREYTNHEVSTIVKEGDSEAPITLVPRMIISRTDVKLEFSLGRTRLYLIKNLIQFAENMEQGSYAKYGKNLAFHHSIQSFDKDVRPLLEFVLELVNTYREHYEQFQKNSFASVSGLRQLNINRMARDRFFDLVEGQTIEIEDYRGQHWDMIFQHGNPNLSVSVKKTGKDGLRVSIDKRWICYSGERHLYVGDREHLFCCDSDYGEAVSMFLTPMVQDYGLNHQIEVNEKDVPLFYERVIKKIEPFTVIESGEIDLEAYKPEELKASFFFSSNGPHELIMEPLLSYGNYSFHPVEDENVPKTVCRDVPGEFRVSQVITKYFKYRDEDGEKLIIRDDEDAVFQVLSQGMQEFSSLGEVRIDESMKNLRLLPSPKISLGVTTSGNWLELTVDTGDMSGADMVKILQEYSRKKKYYRLKNGEFIQLDDEGLMTVARLAEDLTVTRSDLQNKTFRIPKFRALYIDSILKENQDVTWYRDHLFKSVIRGMKSVEDSDFEIPAGLSEILRGYQKTGFKWLRTLDSFGFGGILADDMGLGKTLQIITLVTDEKRQHENVLPSLIICPASLVYNWEHEFDVFSPELKTMTVSGNASMRQQQFQELESTTYDVVITSYDLLKRDMEYYQNMNFRFQIIDEAQYIKNPVTQSAKSVKMIQAQTRFALTGTPIENRLSELWSIFDYLMPGFLFSYPRFRKELEQPIVREQDTDALQRLRKMIGPFILRRLKQDVLKELPEKLETIIYSKFEEEQKKLYTANAVQLKQQLEQLDGGNYHSEKMQVLAALTRLRQICCEPSLHYENYQGGSAKLETCIELIFNGVAGGHKILLFSQFTSMLDIIGKRLQKEKIQYYMLTGATSKEERLRLVNAFHKEDVPVFLISLKAGGTGLNLTAADMVIHYDPWWNVAAQNQATDRAHRIGQTRQVSVFKLITKNTIEENILNLQESKKGLAEQIISEGTVPFSSLTREDVLKLLS